MDDSKQEDVDMDDVPVVVRFVIPHGKTEVTVTDDLSRAFDLSQDAGLGPVWVKEKEVTRLSPTKTDVFVIDPFSGPAFEHVSSGARYKCTVVGPRCLLSCLHSNTPVPELPYPMYTAAMKGLVVTCSGLNKTVKEQVKLLVERMAGIYSTAFHDGVTHLVTNTVRSEKYQVAVDKETPVMVESWVESVWKDSCKETVSAVDGRYSSHRCPSLLGVTVSVSQLSRADKDLLRKSIENHGGGYSGVLEMDKTTVLICASPSGDKYNHAKKWKIPCLSSDWVFDSIEKGYCLPYDSYRVDRKKTNASTPTKQDMTMAGLSEVSMCSTILEPNESNVSVRVDETVVNSTMMAGPSISAAVMGKTTAQWLAQLDISSVKKAGTFLDGCKVFLSGFSDHDQEQLRRVLKFAGATRLTQLVESVTHVVHSVSAAMSPETGRLVAILDSSPHHVNVQWLVESMRRGRPVPESDYPFPPTATDAAAQLLPPPPAVPEEEEETQAPYEAALLAQYGGRPADVSLARPADATETSQAADGSSTMSQVQPFLAGLRLDLVGFAEDYQHDLSDWVNEAGGELVFTDFGGELDYLVTPVEGGRSKHRHKRHVSSHWLEDCLDQGSLVNVQYWHKILDKQFHDRPLEGVVTCLSGYTGKEREFLNSMVTVLGGLPQEIFAKRENKAKGAKASTHLLCPEGSGQKYAAALKWNLAVVTSDWLRCCYREGVWVSEKRFLVGEATHVTEGRPDPALDETEEQEAEGEEDTVMEDNTVMEETVNKSVAEGETSRRSLETSRRSLETSRRSVEVSRRHETGRQSLGRDGDATLDATRKMDETSRGGQQDTPVSSTSSRMSHMALDTPGPALDTPTLERLRPQPLNLDVSVTPQRWADSQPSPSQGGKRRRDEGDELDKMDTPKTPYGAHWTPNPSPRTRKFYKRRIENMPDLQLTELEKRQAERWATQGREETTEYKNKMKEKQFWQDRMDEMLDPQICKERHEKFLDGLEAKGIPVIGRDPRSFDEIMEEKFNKMGKSWKTMPEDSAKRARLELEEQEQEEEERSNVLEGVVVYVAKKLGSSAAEIHSAVESLGGGFRWKYCPEVTHLVFQGKANDLTKEFRTAKEEGKYVVSPDWVNMCREQNTRVQEEAFPHSFNPRMKLDISSTPSMSQTLSSTRPAATRRVRQISGKAKKSPPETDQTRDRLGPVEEDLRQNGSREAEEDEEKKRRSAEISRDLARMEELMESVSRTPAEPVARKVMKTTLTSVDLSDRLASVEGEKEDEERVKESQVMWCDPQEALEREALKDKLDAETQDLGSNNMDTMELVNNMDTMDTFSSMNMGGNQIETEIEDKENRDAAANVPAKKRKLVFMASGWSDSGVEEAVKKLGGQVSDLGQYDSSATHMLAVKVSRSEKMLGSVAAGKWVLHPDYVKDSVSVGRWLDEEKYEWGNPESNFLDLNSGTTEAKLAIAARKWRLSNSGGDEGAFSGISAILHMPPNKKGPFSRLVLAGGGRVVDGKPPYSGATGATHCFTETKHVAGPTSLGSVDMAGLSSRGVLVLVPMFLNDFLTSEGHVNVEEHMLPDFKPHWENRKRSRITTDTPTNAGKKTKAILGN